MKNHNRPQVKGFRVTLACFFAGMMMFFMAGCTNHERKNPLDAGGTSGNRSWIVTSNTLTDPDGNTYTTATIGNQVWTVENLKTTKYNDGTAIPYVPDTTAWLSLSTPGYCWYNNDTSNRVVYGALYNWDVVNTGKLAPAGWHVPTDSDWTTLSTYLGGKNVSGGKLKEAGTAHWFSPNTGATNSYGFSALPGGYRSFNGDFYYQDSVGYWWSSTEFDTLNAWLRTLCYDSESMSSYFSGSCGLSVRLLRD